MVTVHETSDPSQVAFLEMVLRDAGVEFQVENEAGAMAIGPTTATPIRFQVREQDAAAARKAILDALAKMKS